MARRAGKIRSIMAQVNFFNGLMVSAMSGKTVEFRRPTAKLHKHKVILPAIGRQILVIKKINLGEEVSRQRLNQSVASLRSGIIAGINTTNYQKGGTRINANKGLPFLAERFSSRDLGKVDHKRQRHFLKGSNSINDKVF